MFKELGALYLILGTCIAAGLLGLPIVTASGNYLVSVAYIISAWVLMTAGAWCLLQVNLSLESGSNLITMSAQTLGKTIKAITWAVYLLLLYSLICAYLAASGDLMHVLLSQVGVNATRSISTGLATLILGAIVYYGIRSVDLVNRGLMTIKIIICVCLIFMVAPHVHLAKLSLGGYQWHGATWLVVICSFGYAIILPSIRQYLHSDRRRLQRVVLIGSCIPALLYLLWIAVIQGALPRYGANGLLAMNHVANTNSMLMQQLIALTKQPLLHSLSVVFISICSITGLLGVSICLVDFLADGLNRKKQGWNKIILLAITYLPPMLIVILKPQIFINALAYAGMCCIYVLIILPIAMYLAMKYKHTLKHN